jgi:putative nucleotidyltransferase with HDIG domain
MSINAKHAAVSPALVATTWLNRQLVSVIATVHRRLHRRLILTSSAIAFVAGVGVLALSSLVVDVEGHLGEIDAAVLAVAASVMTAAALYAVVRQRERWLLRAASTISRDNIDMWWVLGKLTELRDGETAGHNLRVTTYTLLLAEALDLPPEEIVRTTKGALLHDVGKLAVPDRILGKPGPLTPEERAEMAKHVRFGLEIVSQSEILHEAAAVVGSHHERYDGKGYPLGLRGEAIPREARLFALVDVFDALTSARVYKAAFSVEEALATMAGGRGSHFDPALFDRFREMAPDLARRLPDDEAALTSLLMDRLLPYLERVVHVAPMFEAMDSAPTVRIDKDPGPAIEAAVTEIFTEFPNGKGK